MYSYRTAELQATRAPRQTYLFRLFHALLCAWWIELNLAVSSVSGPAPRSLPLVVAPAQVHCEDPLNRIFGTKKSCQRREEASLVSRLTSHLAVASAVEIEREPFGIWWGLPLWPSLEEVDPVGTAGLPADESWSGYLRSCHSFPRGKACCSWNLALLIQGFRFQGF